MNANSLVFVVSKTELMRVRLWFCFCFVLKDNQRHFIGFYLKLDVVNMLSHHQITVYRCCKINVKYKH